VKVIAKGKGINLTPREKKPKKDKYSELSDIKPEFKFEASDSIKLIYLGLLDEYKGSECIVIKNSRRKNIEYYRVKFDDDFEADTSMGFLRTLEEYKQLVLDQEKANAPKEKSAIEIEMIKNGIEPHLNSETCLSPLTFYHRGCSSDCTYEERCIYRNKYDYSVIKF